jgi:hypothetical protein
MGIRQSTKTDKELYKKYLDLCGADPKAYVLHEHTDLNVIYSRHNVGNRQDQLDTINMINEFDGMCYILIKFDGNERVEDYALLKTLIIYWDARPIAKRIKKLHKVKSKIIS